MKFNVGDRVHWHDDPGDTGTILEKHPRQEGEKDDSYRVYWDVVKGASSWYSLFLRPLPWHDFQEKIRERMK